MEIGSTGFEPSPEKPEAASIRRPWRLVLWLALPVLVWASFRSLDLEQVWATLRGLDPGAIATLALVNLGVLALFASRWWLILRGQGYRLPYFHLVGYRLSAFGITYFTPGTQVGGEPLQVYLLCRHEKVPYEAAIASVGLDKLLELLSNFTFLLVGVGAVLATGLGAGRISSAVIALPAILLALPLAYMAALGLGWRPGSALVGWLAERRPDSSRLTTAAGVLSMTEEHAARFVVRRPTHLLLALLASLVIWLAMIFEFALALHLLGLRLSLPQVLLALTAARLAFLLPVPAGLGSLEAGQVLAMGMLGLNPALGIGLSLIIRVRDILFGGAGLWLGGLLSR